MFIGHSTIVLAVLAQATFVLDLDAGAAFELLLFVLYADTRATSEERSWRCR